MPEKFLWMIELNCNPWFDCVLITTVKVILYNMNNV